MIKVIKVVIVDDHLLVRTGVERILTESEDIEVIGLAASGEEAIQLARELSPNIILMDVKMPGIGGIEATRKIARSNPNIHIIGLTASGDETFVQLFLQAGAKGYLTKGTNPEEMLRALRLVAAGQCYVDPTLASGLLVRSPNSQNNPFAVLSEREMQVTLMLVNCQKVQEIADSLFVSPRTINTYRYRIFDKLAVRNDVELTHLAIRHKLIDVTD